MKLTPASLQGDLCDFENSVWLESQICTENIFEMSVIKLGFWRKAISGISKTQFWLESQICIELRQNWTFQRKTTIFEKSIRNQQAQQNVSLLANHLVLTFKNDKHNIK